MRAASGGNPHAGSLCGESGLISSFFCRGRDEITSNHRRWPELGSGRTGGEETRGYGRFRGFLPLRGCVFPLLHPECHRCARRFGALCAPEALAGVFKGLETPFLGIRHCESCVRVSVDEGIALSHETFTCACPDCPQHERLTFCAAGVVLSQPFFRGAAPLHPAEWQWGPQAPSRRGIERGSGEKTELFFSPLLKVTHCTDPACLCHNDCCRLYLCLACARLSGCACMLTQGLAFSHCACPTLHSMTLTFCVARLAASQFFIAGLRPCTLLCGGGSLRLQAEDTFDSHALLKVTHSTDPTCLCHINCCSL
jgi:hypothetical protein